MIEFIEVGVVTALFRYPVKSMRGELLDEVDVGWHGFEGDRRYAFIRLDAQSAFPWLTGRDVPYMLRYTPSFVDPNHVVESAIQVRTPAGRELALDSEELRQELTDLHGAPLHLLHIGRGTFDSMPVSLISLASVHYLGAQIGRDLDPLRFRPNIIIETTDGQPFAEERWIGQRLVFGTGVQIRADRKDKRCMMVNLEPDTAQQDPRVLKEITRTRQQCTGIYGSVEAPGRIRVGDVVRVYGSKPQAKS